MRGRARQRAVHPASRGMAPELLAGQPVEGMDTSARGPVRARHDDVTGDERIAVKKCWTASGLTLVSQRTRPVFSSSARKSPLHEPMNTRSPTTVGVWASHPPASKCRVASMGQGLRHSMPPARIIIDTSDAETARMRKVFVLSATVNVQPTYGRLDSARCAHQPYVTLGVFARIRSVRDQWRR